MEERLQTQEDIEEILKIAVSSPAEHAHTQGDLRAQLQAAGRELGLSQAELEAAEAKWSAQKTQSEVSRFARIQRRKLFVEIGIYMVVNAILVTLALSKQMDEVFASASLVAWGIYLYLLGRESLDPQSDGFKKRLEAWKQTNADSDEVTPAAT